MTAPKERAGQDEPDGGERLTVRLLWFAGLWFASVLTLAGIAMLIRLALGL